MDTLSEQLVRIRGVKDGILVTLGNGRFLDVYAELASELSQKENFLQGSQVTLDVGLHRLYREQLADLLDLFARHRLVLWTVLADAAETREAAQDLNLATRVPGSQTDLDGRPLSIQNPITPIESPIERPTPPDGALFLKETLRSGRSVYHEGPVVVMGDVNPGAEIIAAGDVIVWGRLRGLVHAGALGDETAVICALSLNPTQLRIADQIAISPNGDKHKPAPEIVSIRDKQIVAESWQQKH
ncbi:MAG: septum site-determining protein MinC [Chloroflexota bacterium]